MRVPAWTQTQLFAEPLQSLITIRGDRCRHNLMLVNLVEAIAHRTKPDRLVCQLYDDS
jgi:hypothetical protein